MVKAYRERVLIPTYEVGKPEKNPIFLEKRVYQGSSGVVYPYPVIESISDEKHDKYYDAIYLENEYIKVMILPELGGRVQMAWDKIRRRHFIYYNSVIKPALVGLAGPWISGGIEINWPQHHRPSTFMPIDAQIEYNPDGSVTVAVSERERMTHQKSTAGYTLYPGKAYLEVRGMVYNPTEVPQTFLWWANPAVKVNDDYQSVFPPDVNAVYDHGKRAVSTFPIATGVYYKMDYSAGVDISNYKNIKVPTSYMICDSRFDFEGGYEHDTHCGMLHVANHHISPGKKQWTWGNGDFGWAWDRNLTDSDGPYIEVMAGVYAENQPDFTWLQPYEEKKFVQYFLPYHDIGMVKNASKDLLLNVEPEGDGVRVMLFATSAQSCTLRLVRKNSEQSGKKNGEQSGEQSAEKEVSLSPEEVFNEKITCGGIDFDDLQLLVVKSGRTVMEWHHEVNTSKPVPDPAKPALLPEEIKTCEQLFLTGLHLEQYRHATYNPVDYYEEALRRDPSDIRNNNALGLLYIRKGRFDKAEKYLRMAVETLQERNKNPYDGEPIYNLGLSLRYQYRYDEAYERFYKSTWNGAWQDAGYFACAQISCLRKDFESALDEVNLSLNRNYHNHKGLALKISILRHMGQEDAAARLVEEALSLDAFNYGALYEKYLLSGDAADLDNMVSIMHADANDYDQLALDYCGAGLWKEAEAVWNTAVAQNAVTPMTLYYLAWAVRQSGEGDCMELLSRAEKVSPDYCFPNRLEAVLALESAIELAPGDAKAPYYLGNLYYDKRQYDLAVSLWEKSDSLCGTFPTVKRNLALAYYNKTKDSAKAVSYMEAAFELDPSDARVLMELDQLYKVMQYPHKKRLSLLYAHLELVALRDDLSLELATLLNLTAHFREAKNFIYSRKFHPWEGGEGKVPEQYQLCRVCIAIDCIKNAAWDEAIENLEECFEYPHTLGEGKLFNAQESDFYYLLALAYAGKGDSVKAAECLEKGVKAPAEPAAALYYNDAKPEKIFYAGLCLGKLGREKESAARFKQLLDYGKEHLDDKVRMDYFAVSLPDLLIWNGDLTRKNHVHCLFMMALGYWGLGDKAASMECISKAAAEDINHLAVFAALRLMDSGI